MTPSLRALLTCARQELLLAVRSRFLLIFALVFAGLSILVSTAGYILSGGTGMQDFARTAAALVDVVLLVVPLAALMIGVTALTPEAGSSELLFSQPVPRRVILAGKLMGLAFALIAAESLGFGASGLVLFSRTGAEGLPQFLGVIAAAAVLTLIFLSLAAGLTSGGSSRRRTRSLATALVVWFGAVVLFDIAMLGLAAGLPSRTASRVLMVAVVVNPVDAVRTATLLGIEGTTAFGAASLAFLRFTGGSTGAAGWLAFSVAVWIAVPLALAVRRLRRADL